MGYLSYFPSSSQLRDKYCCAVFSLIGYFFKNGKELHVNGIILYVHIVDLLLSFKKAFERFSRVDVLNKW